MCNRITAHAQPSDYHLVRASPRHPAKRFTAREKKFGVPLTVPELVKQKSRGPPGSDFVIDDGTEKTLGMVVGVTQ
ncbi:hypothetical protein CSW71_26110 [Shigella sonnei]|nr:hypothetical protein CSW71_26110 [Shigella sonnei]